jgi:hypothetical protein
VKIEMRVLLGNRCCTNVLDSDLFKVNRSSVSKLYPDAHLNPEMASLERTRGSIKN